VDGRIGATRLSRDGRRALVGFTREARSGPGRTFLRVVDLAGRRPGLTVDLGAYGDVTDVWPSHEGTRAWVAAEEGGRVLTVDTRTGDLLMIWTIGESSSQAGAVSAGDRHIYVTNREAGTLTIIDRATVGARTVELGRGVSAVDLWERGARTVWLANALRDELVAVSGRSGDVVARLSSGGRGPIQLRVRPGSDEIWVAHEESRDVVLVDARDHRILDRIPLDVRPRDLTFSRDGAEVYVNASAGVVVEIDAEARSVTRSVREAAGSADVVLAGCLSDPARSCGGEARDPWTDATGLPRSWLDDQGIVDGRMCGFRAHGDFRGD
jgi:DNA-binding beta-propeller fold protein YncE